jgi:polyhydroxyalkanoate synthesis regulator phasin
MADEQKRTDPGDALREGVRALTGILGAFKDAIEQTFDDLTKRGDLSPERARESASDAMTRVQQAIDDMRGRVDFVTRKEFDALKAEVAELRAQSQSDAARKPGGTPDPRRGTGDAAPGGLGDDRPGL